MTLELKPRVVKVSEKKVETAAKRWARDHGWYVRKFTSPAHRSVPDDLFVKDSRVVFIEMKKPGETPTDNQWDEIEEIRDHGGEADWADSVDRVKDILSGQYEQWHRF